MFEDYSYKKDSSERSPSLSGILPLKLQPAKILKQWSLKSYANYYKVLGN
jgi:hypothetical protein